MSNNLDRKIAPEVGGFESLSLPPMRTATLSNGLTLNIIDYGQQEVTRLTAIWDSGNAETADIPKSLNLAATLLREGTASTSGREIAEALDFNGAWLTTTVESHNTTINLFSLNSKFDEPLDILIKIISEPSFPATEFDTYRCQMAQTAALNERKVSFLAEQERVRLTYGSSHPLAVTVTPDQILQISRDDVVNAYSRVIRASLPTVYLSGRVTREIEEKAIKALERLDFPAAKRGLNVVELAPDGSLSAKVDVDDAVQNALSFTIPTITRDHPDYIPLRMLVIMLGGFFGSRLTSNIREDKGYTYGINAGLFGMREGGQIVVSTQCDPAYVGRVADEVRNELSRLRTDGFSESEIANMRKFVTSQLASILESPFTISDNYQLQQVCGTPDDYFRQQFQTVNAIDSDKLTLMAQRYIDLDHLYIVNAGK